MLLRTAGLQLANRLLHLLKQDIPEARADKARAARKQAALQSIAAASSAWMAIMLVTTAGGRHRGNQSLLQEEFLNEAIEHGFGQNSEDAFSRTALTARMYIEDHLREEEEEQQASSPVASANTFEHESLNSSDDDDNEVNEVNPILPPPPLPQAARPLPRLPRMYLQQARRQDLLEEGREEGSGDEVPLSLDITLPKKANKAMLHAWDYCWKRLSCGTTEGVRLPLFGHLLLHVCSIAKNIVHANALYLVDHITSED
jgi:hypothetical protein